MEATMQKPAGAARSSRKATIIIYWIVTALFCLQMGFTALRATATSAGGGTVSPAPGFPAYFHVERSVGSSSSAWWVLLAPVPALLKEWACAGCAIVLASALIAHFSVGDGPEMWGWASSTCVLWGLSYFFWRRLQPT